MNFKIERIFRVAVVPFLTAATLIGTGFAFWSFGGASDSAENEIETAGLLSVAGRYEFGEMVIELPLYHDGYRLVFDQGSDGIGGNVISERGVYVSPSVRCTLHGLPSSFGEDELKSLYVSYSIQMSNPDCPVMARLKFVDPLGGNAYQSIAYRMDDVDFVITLESDGSITARFEVDPPLEWASRPESAAEWTEFVNHVRENVDSGDHILTLNVTNEPD